MLTIECISERFESSEVSDIFQAFHSRLNFFQTIYTGMLEKFGSTGQQFEWCSNELIVEAKVAAHTGKFIHGLTNMRYGK